MCDRNWERGCDPTQSEAQTQKMREYVGCLVDLPRHQRLEPNLKKTDVSDILGLFKGITQVL